MDALIMASQIILALAILVTLHELGHFVAARMFGIKVEKFYLFFDAWGFKLFSFKHGDTEYGIGWLPLGGYVKIAGMIDESMDTEQLKKEAEPWEFRSKPAWQRLIVMIGGVTVNFVLGFLIFILATWYYGESKLPLSEVKYGIHAQEVGRNIGLKDGDVILGVNGVPAKYIDEIKKPSVFLNSGNYYDVMRDGQSIKLTLPDNIIDQISDKKNSLFDLRMPCIVDSVAPGFEAEKAGLKKNDQVIGLNDTAVEWYHEYKERIVNYGGKKTNLRVLRGADTLSIPVTVSKDGTLGFFQQVYYFNSLENIDYSFAAAIPAGSSKASEALSDNITGLKKLVSGKIDPRKSVQGPIGIATMFGSTWVWERFWALTGLLSLILAFMNLLPIPALDGGHVVFLIVEMIIRRPLSEKFMQVMQVIGMVLLLGLMVFAFGNDIYKIFSK
jgi:regulator of sigma E protease